jgi:hypothetical protein
VLPCGAAVITEIPTAADLSEFGLSYLDLAWDAGVELGAAFWEAKVESWDDGGAKEEFWRASQPTLGNAFALVHQAQEFALKSRIAAVSPYLLLTRDVRDWPKGSDTGNTPFSQFRTIDAGDLPRLCNIVSGSRLPPNC